jgi:hypothetical protein
MILAKFIGLLAVSITAYSIEYKDREYVIPPDETPAILQNSCDENYVPVHSRELLRDVQAWAVGGVIQLYLTELGYNWDQLQYVADNPHRGLFNFGMATGTKCLEIWVLKDALNWDHALSVAERSARHSGEVGQELYRRHVLELAIELGFEKYIIPADGVANQP